MPFTCCGGGEGLLWKERVGTPREQLFQDGL